MNKKTNEEIFVLATNPLTPRLTSIRAGMHTLLVREFGPYILNTVEHQHIPGPDSGLRYSATCDNDLTATQILIKTGETVEKLLQLSEALIH